MVIVQAEENDATDVVDSAAINEDADEQTDTEVEIEVSYGKEETSGALSYDCLNGESRPRDLRLLATNKTSTMEREMNEAADAGYRLQDVMGGETAFGGSEVAAVMCKLKDAGDLSRYQYKLLATNKTSTMQKELQEAGDAGYEYRGQTVFSTAFGSQEVVVILERDQDATPDYSYEYKLLATRKTSTMQKELQEAGDAGYEFVGLTVASTSFGGAEVVAILRRQLQNENQ
jgi:hypothetical protein